MGDVDNWQGSASLQGYIRLKALAENRLIRYSRWTCSGSIRGPGLKALVSKSHYNNRRARGNMGRWEKPGMPLTGQMMFMQFAD